MEESKKDYSPVEDYLMVVPDTMPENIGTIILPERSRVVLAEGRIEKIGPRVVDLKVGDGVVFKPNTDYRYELDGKIVSLVREADVILRY